MKVSRGFSISDITIVFGIVFSKSPFAFLRSATFFCASTKSTACVSRKNFCSCCFCSGVRFAAGIAASLQGLDAAERMRFRRASARGS